MGAKSFRSTCRTRKSRLSEKRLTICLLGVLGDLNTPDEAVDLLKSRREADAYERVLAGLGRGEFVLPDEAAREAVEAMAIASDREDNYAEVIARHDALFGLLDHLGGVRIEER